MYYQQDNKRIRINFYEILSSRNGGILIDIAALSMALSQMNVRQEVTVSVMRKSMDQAESNGQNVVRILEQSVQPHLGGSVDLKL